MKRLKQRDHELNQMRIDNQQLCKNVEELKKIVNEKRYRVLAYFETEFKFQNIYSKKEKFISSSNESDTYCKNLQSVEEKNRDLAQQIDFLKSSALKEEAK